MDWNTYEPLSTDNILRLDDDIDLISGDGLTVYEPDGSKTKYLLVSVLDDGSVNLWNYSKSKFESRVAGTIEDWRENGATVSPVFTEQEFTVRKEPNTEEIVGLKFHGGGVQWPQTIDQHGKLAFANHLQVAIVDDTRGDEISEPYTTDEAVIHPEVEGLQEEAYDTLVPLLVKRTALTEETARDIITHVLVIYEYNARTRNILTTDEWLFSESKSDAEEKVGNPNENSVDGDVFSWNTNTGDEFVMHN